MKLVHVIFLILISFNVLAKSEFSNVMFLKEGHESPKADLSAVSWLTGHWRGEAFGGITEEIWAPALGGSMMGAFKLVVGGRVQLYEIETISEEDDSLIFRLRHFHKDLKAWEEKDETVDFKLVKVVADRVYFSGLTLERVNGNEMNIYVVIEENGKSIEEKFTYNRISQVDGN